MFNMCKQKKLERDFFVYMQKENAAVVTNVLGFSMCPPIRGIVQAIQNCMMVAFLYVVSIYAIQNQHYTMHIMLQRAWTRTPEACKIQSWDI